MHGIRLLFFKDAGQRPNRTRLPERVARTTPEIERHDARAKRLELRLVLRRPGDDDDGSRDLPQDCNQRLKMR